MKLKAVVRRIATRSTDSPSPLVALNRQNPSSVLNLTQNTIVSQLLQTNREIGLASKIRVNRFFVALFKGNTNEAVTCIQGLRKDFLRQKNEKGQVYISCLVSLLSYLLKDFTGKLQSRNLTGISQEILKIPKDVGLESQPDVDYIHKLTVLLFLKCLKGTNRNESIEYLNLVTHIRLLLKKFDCTPEDILEAIETEQVDVIEQYNIIFAQNLAVPSANANDPSIDVSKYADEHGNLSFESLCSLIEEQTFDALAYSKTKLKLYETYDRLDQDQKRAFMDEYLQFNREKQLLIEGHCHNISKAYSFGKKFTEFSLLHQTWFRTWVGAVVNGIKKLSEEQSSFKRYDFIVNLLTEHTLASMCVSHMIASSITSANVKVLPLTQQLWHVTWSELRKLNAFDKNTQIRQIFQQEDAIKFFSEIVNITISSCKLPPEYPFTENLELGDEFGDRIFSHKLAKPELEFSKYKLYGVINLHPYVAESFRSYLDFLAIGSYRLPMLHPPKKWDSPSNGGFLSFSVPLIKSSQPHSFEIVAQLAHNTGQLSSFYESLSALGSTPWAINPFTLQAFTDALSNDKMTNLAIPTLARIQHDLTELSKQLDMHKQKLEPALLQITKIKQKKLQLSRDRDGLVLFYTMICRFAQSLSKRGEVFYLPHNLDFRGRVYPCVSFLCTHNDDLVRSLMMFWEAKELGPKGYDWLRYQLANLHSTKKLDMKESISFVEANRKNIIDSAENPLEGERWWASGDSPWQSLAVCKELNSIWNFEGDIADYKSRIPIHQDGSCNGLQHYAALSGDKKAAESVNVLPSKQRQDVYLMILSLVKARVLHDSTGEENSDLAKLVLPFLQRKLVKQTVMTSVYSVTLYGATKQIQGQLEDLIMMNRDDPALQVLETQKARASSYIARHVLGSINELFHGAQLIQNWLIDNCSRCLQSFDPKESDDPSYDFFDKKHYEPFMWTSLSGFPVVQYYRSMPSKRVVTSLQTVRMRKEIENSPIDQFKLRNGIAPNFIHSVDATHLLMTALAARTNNITFAAVHDSFWTHPSEVEVLSHLIREEFVRLHKSEVMENMLADLTHVYSKKVQLVWVDRNSKENERFMSALQSLRSGYSDLKERISLRDFNRVLKHEAKNLLPIIELVEDHKPELLFQPTTSGELIIYDDSPTVKAKDAVFCKKNYVPLLVPVKVLKLPKFGTIDLDLVKESTFFFS
ncbi:hypothetical protein PUMCH_002781 [Australozyma saopauloensis]|uniref:DNA-directed RNA polymerase n=1 Tax=Australozyma saopauloensis TaxID=291208 RepID=A0AAX4HAS9_9ASCO|nr:hypothetical protein PUMCH_002781 [[Candida] saopauloensis]